MKKLLVFSMLLMVLFSCSKEDIPTPNNTIKSQSQPKAVGCMCNDGTAVWFNHPNFPLTKTDTSQCSIIRTGIMYVKYYPQYSVLGEWKSEKYTYTLKGFKNYVYDEKILSSTNQQIPGFKGTDLWVDKPNPNAPAGGCVGKRTTSVQCGGTTQSGSRCKNNTLSCNGNCYLHGGN
jgi:hypothetical protein